MAIFGGTTINYPEQQPYGESMRDVLRAQIDLGPEYFQGEAEARRRYAQLETDILRDTLLGRGGEQGMLDFMGAPAQKFATGDVQYEPPWVDPAKRQFDQGYMQQQQQQARAQRATQQQPSEEGGGEQMIGEGQNQRIRRDAQQQPYQAPWEQQVGIPYGEQQQMDRQRGGPLAGGGPFAGVLADIRARQARGEDMGPGASMMDIQRGRGPMGGGRGPQQARGGYGGQPPARHQFTEDAGWFDEDDSGQRWFQPRMPDSGGQMQAQVMPDRIQVDAEGYAQQEGAAQPIMGQELASAGGAVTGAIGEGQNQRVRRGKVNQYGKMVEVPGYGLEAGAAPSGDWFYDTFGWRGKDAPKLGMSDAQTAGMPKNQLAAAQKWTTAKVRAEERGKAVPPMPAVLQGTSWGDQWGRVAEPLTTWEDVDAGRGREGAGDVTWEDVGARVDQPAERAYTGDARTVEQKDADILQRFKQDVDIPDQVPEPSRERWREEQGEREQQGEREEQYMERPTSYGRMMEGYRRPGYEMDTATGEEEFGGLAQYGADIAEYGQGRQRAADIRDVGKYGQAATQALRQADPLSSAILGRMSGIAGQELAGAGSGRYGDLLTSMRTQAGAELSPGEEGYGGLLGQMQTQAMAGLKAQGGLTDRERRNAIQSARQAAEARGRSYDPLALVGELESLEGAQRARRAEQRGFAGQTMAAEEARKGSARQYAANLLQMEGARRGEARGFAGGVMGQSRAMSADPFMAILGRQSGAGQQVAQNAFGGAQYGLSAGPGVVYNPEAGLNYMLGQQGNQANLAAAQAGARAQKGAGMASMIGTLGAAMICWVAREVYGEDNPKWKQFRSWMLNKAPTAFRDWYIQNGERVAEWLKDKPEIKARVKVFMDSKLEA